MADAMSQRALNRATLARQHLLRRVDLPADTMIEHVVGMQAQNPKDPYVALWSRLAAFVPEELEALMNDRRAVRMTLYRSTIHLVTDRDALAVRPLVQPVVERMFKGSPFSKKLGGASRDELLAAGRELMDEQPRTRAEVQRILGERWPDGDAESLAHAVRWLTPTVQVTPRGLWSRSGQPKLATLESWLGRSLDGAGSLDDLVLRYLGAFGPASVMDAQMWCGLTRLRDVFDRLAPRLRVFRDEQGRELFDLPDAPCHLPDDPGRSSGKPWCPKLALFAAKSSPSATLGSLGARKPGVRLPRAWIVAGLTPPDPRSAPPSRGGRSARSHQPLVASLRCGLDRLRGCDETH